MGKKEYFTIEFICDSGQDVKDLCKKLMAKYPIFPHADKGTRITSWIDGRIPDEEVYKSALTCISNQNTPHANATVKRMALIAEGALGYNNE